MSKETLRESFEDSPELIQSALYRHVYTNAYDQPGADPYSAIVSNYEFDSSPQDIALLRTSRRWPSSAHCPFLAPSGPKFFGKDSTWRSGRRSRTSRPTWRWRTSPSGTRCATRRTRATSGSRSRASCSRLPYGQDTVPVKSFNYNEEVTGADHDKYLWGNVSFAFASNMVKAFQRDGWSVQIRGPQSGGKVDDLPVHLYDVGKGKQAKIPTEVPISETLEFEAANLGFMPLSHYQGRDFAAFFSANSTQRPKLYDDDAATANSRINARLPYIFLASRIAHYLKVLQRENIGATKDASTIELELNTWLKGLVTEMENPTQAARSRSTRSRRRR